MIYDKWGLTNDAAIVMIRGVLMLFGVDGSGWDADSIAVWYLSEHAKQWVDLSVRALLFVLVLCIVMAASFSWMHWCCSCGNNWREH